MNNKLQQYLLGNIGEAFNLIREVNAWSGTLEHLEFLYMEDLDMYLEGLTPTEIANKIYFGDFNPHHDYFQFNAYANLVSYDYYEMKEEVAEYIDDVIEAIIEHRDHIDIPDEVMELLEMDAE